MVDEPGQEELVQIRCLKGPQVVGHYTYQTHEVAMMPNGCATFLAARGVVEILPVPVAQITIIDEVPTETDYDEPEAADAAEESAPPPVPRGVPLVTRYDPDAEADEQIDAHIESVIGAESDDSESEDAEVEPPKPEKKPKSRKGRKPGRPRGGHKPRG